MSDEGERTCPLCTEEMDLTDQQLKPCKCGYEICVWCWHHIIDMAEKDDTEGRCPACRTLYDKDKIVGMAANCERMMAEINAEKRQKSHKAKPKTSTEARKHLSSVRVIQRNLVYIIGLPSNLADENMLDRKEYFGQYGKVLKVSISRPAGASIQQASNNNTFSVYITYAKEEEAVRCIQAVHNFLLEGKPLRACFGTTKYCHAWLRNMTCSNPDCLYLHDIGTQEDSFTKDEIISSYTRNRVPQVATNNPQRRSGYMLPPPADDFCNSGTVSGKHVVKSAPNNTSVSHVKGSPPNTCAGRSTVLPAAASWGLRVSNCQLPAASMACSQGPIKLKSETVNSSSILSSVVASTKQTSAWYDDLDETPQIPEIKHVVPLEGRSKALEPLKSGFSRDCRTTASDISAETSLGAARTSGMSMSCSSSTLAPATEDKDIGILVPENYSNPADSPQDSDRQSNSGSDKVGHGCTTVDGNVQGLCLGLSSVNIDSHLGFDRPSVDQNQSSVSNHCSTGMTRSPDSVLRQNYPEPGIETLASVPSSSDPVISVPHVSRELSDWSSELQKQVLPSTGNEVEDVLVADDDQRNRLTDVINQPSYLPHLYHPLSNSNHSINHSWNNDVGTTCPLVNGNSRSMDEPLLPSRRNESVLSNGHNGDMLSSAAKLGKGFECPDRNSTVEEVKLLRRFRDVPNIDKRSVDIGENNIISDILSLDFDPWDDSLSSPNHFAKLLGETDQQNGSSKPSSSWKIPNSNQSRFSFARQENQTNLLEPSFGDIGHAQKISSTSQDFYRDGFRNGQSISNFEASSAFANSHSVFSSDKTAGVSRAKISAPPGFSAPSRAPPPGFSSQDRSDQSYDTTCSDNYLLGSSTLGNQYQPHLTGNTGDVEFIDPAILAVGKGRLPVGVNNSGLGLRSAFPSTPFSTSESDPRLQLLMQQSISAHQDLRFSAHQDLRFSAHQDLRFSDHSATSAHQDLRFSDHIADRFLPSSDAYIPSRLVTQNHNNLSPFAQMSLQQPRNSRISNSQWDGWNGLLTGNDVGMAEILRNERLGLNKTFPGNEEHKFHMSNSSDLYNRAFGM